jgi:alkylhydroperoxidase family enzyme
MNDAAWIPMLGLQEAEGKLRELFDVVCDPATGNTDHILQVHSLHPAGLEAHMGLYTAVMRGTPSLPKVDRELVAYVVSQVNHCHY